AGTSRPRRAAPVCARARAGRVHGQPVPQRRIRGRDGDLRSRHPMSDRRLTRWQIAAVAALLAVLLAALVAVQTRVPFPVGLPGTGTWQSNTVLAFQLAVFVVGIASVHLVPATLAPYVLICEGAVLLLAHGWRGLVWSGFVLLVYLVLAARTLGRGRVLLLAAILIA